MAKQSIWSDKVARQEIGHEVVERWRRRDGVFVNAITQPWVMHDLGFTTIEYGLVDEHESGLALCGYQIHILGSQILRPERNQMHHVVICDGHENKQHSTLLHYEGAWDAIVPKHLDKRPSQPGYLRRHLATMCLDMPEEMWNRKPAHTENVELDNTAKVW